MPCCELMRTAIKNLQDIRNGKINKNKIHIYGNKSKPKHHQTKPKLHKIKTPSNKIKTPSDKT